MFLGRNIGKVVLQFFLDSANLIPTALLNEERLSLAPVERRPERILDGELVIDHQPNCSVRDFLIGLEEAGYQLIDAYWQKRFKGSEPYYVVRFSFLRKEGVRFSPRIDLARTLFRPAFLKMATSANWKVWAYQNPRHININLGDRSSSAPRAYLYVMNREIQLEVF